MARRSLGFRRRILGSYLRLQVVNPDLELNDFLLKLALSRQPIITYTDSSVPFGVGSVGQHPVEFVLAQLQFVEDVVPLPSKLGELFVAVTVLLVHG